MDTLTHALSGALVGRVLAARRAPAGSANAAAPGTASGSRPAVPVWQMVAAGTVAAIFPDLGFVLARANAVSLSGVTAALRPLGLKLLHGPLHIGHQENAQGRA